MAFKHIVLLWIRGKNGFVDQRGGSATLFYENIADITNVLNTGCLLLQSLLGDGVIVSIAILVSCIDSSISKKIWRLYVVYDKRPWVIVPAIILVFAYTGATHSGVNDGHAVNKLSFTAVGCVAFQFIVKARLGTDIFHVATSWITAFFALTMSTNVLCSGKRIPLRRCLFPTV